jgi:hypothetical protein
MSDDNQSDMSLAIDHAAAVVLVRLAQEGRGWTTLQPSDPLLAEANDLAKDEAAVRGVAAEDVNVSAQLIYARAQEMAADGADPQQVVANTKAERAADPNSDPDAPIIEANTATGPISPQRAEQEQAANTDHASGTDHAGDTGEGNADREGDRT